MHFLSELGWKVPHAFGYASTRMILAAITTLVLTIALGKSFIRWLYKLKIGHSVRVSDCRVLKDKYVKSEDVPSMGGLLFLTSIIISSLLWMDLTSAFTFILLVTTLWMGFLGGMDDLMKIKHKNRRGLSPRAKMIGQMVWAALIALYLLVPSCTHALEERGVLKPPVAKEWISQGGAVENLTTQQYALEYFIPFYKKPIVVTGIGLLAAFLLTLLVVVGSTNAVNFTDGLDGLAAGCVLLVALVLSIFAFLSNNMEISHYLNILYIEGSGEIAIFLAATMGGCLGFLWYNGYPAQLFMGDTGSLALGGILGVSAVLLRREFLYALVGGVFVVEALSVILQVASFRLRGGRRIFLCAPLHHHFEIKGWHETKVVTRFWMIGLMLALIGLASLKIQ